MNLNLDQSIVISEFALTQLKTINSQSRDIQNLVHNTIQSILRRDLAFELLHIKGYLRPIWRHEIDNEYVIYYTFGKGKEREELRIAYLGGHFDHNKETLGKLLVLAGETSYGALSDEICINELLTMCQIPEFPERKLKPHGTLKEYLTPSEKDLLDAISQENREEDLYGMSYRVIPNLKSAASFPIRLSPQQERILDKPLPLLLQGVAGSGKTTVMVAYAHRLLLKTMGESSILILAYTNQLKYAILQILESTATLVSADVSCIKVQTWEELCNDQAETLGIKPFNWAPESFFLDFLNMYLKKNSSIKKVAEISTDIHEFIRGTVKGGSMGLSTVIPTRAEFLELRKTPLDEYIKRTELYDLIQHYQYALQNRNLLDQTDVARSLIQYIGKLKKYDYVLVDEVQDYAAVQLELITRMATSAKGILFTGDLNQVLYPSYFSWEKVRSAIWNPWKIQAPHPISINYNYRNPRPVVEIANILIEKRDEVSDHSQIKNIISNQSLTPKPLRFVGTQKDINNIIEQLAIKIGSLAIIREEQQDELIIQNIAVERIFTPQLAKGLEFNVVCLVNFNERYHHLTSKNFFSQRRLLQDYNEIYVAITRTRVQLILLDRNTSNAGIWGIPEIYDHIEHENDKVSLINIVSARFSDNTKQAWEFDARDFESQLAYASAGECWERAGNPLKAAKNYELAEKWQKALNIYLANYKFRECAEVFEKLEKLEEAAAYYEKAGLLQKAAAIWGRIRQHFHAAKMYHEVAKSNNTHEDWLNAGFHYEKCNEFESSAECYLKASDEKNAARSLERCKQFLKAASLWERANDPKNAAACYSNCQQYAKAAEMFELCFEWENAGDNWELATQFPDAIRCFRRSSNKEKTARLLSYTNQWLESAKNYEQAGLYADAAVCYEKSNNKERAATLFHHSGQFLRAGDLWEEMNRFEDALQSYIEAKHSTGAARCFEALNLWDQAGRHWLLTGDLAKAANCLNKFGAYVKAAKTWEKIAMWSNAGESWEKADKFSNALKCYQKVDDASGIARCLVKLTRYSDAALFYQKAGDDYQTAVCYDIIGNHTKAAEFFEKCNGYAKAAESYEKGENFDKASLFYQRAGLHKESADCYVRCKNWFKAAKIYELLKDFEQAAINFERADHKKNAALAFQNAHKWIEASIRWLALNQYQQAESCLLREINSKATIMLINQELLKDLIYNCVHTSQRCKANRDRAGARTCFRMLGIIFEKTKNYQNARRYYQRGGYYGHPAISSCL